MAVKVSKNSYEINKNIINRILNNMKKQEKQKEK